MQTAFAHPRRIRSVFAISLACLSLAQFLIYYIVFGSFQRSIASLMAASYCIDLLEALFPPLAALAIFLTLGGGLKNKILPSLLISFTKLFYTIPFYYIYLVADVYNSREALIYSFFISIAYIIYTFLQIFICIYLLNRVESKLDEVKRIRERSKLFDIDEHVNFGILLSVCVPLIISLIRNTVDTVSYLIEASGNYHTDEILAILLSYAVVLVSAFIGYALCAFIKNLVLRLPKATDEPEEIAP
ncbi:MAG: hypothetical protein IKV16_05090 [Clostridia bacterium]|nr:hypothetical protein [Clostridia bacterium]